MKTESEYECVKVSSDSYLYSDNFEICSGMRIEYGVKNGAMKPGDVIEVVRKVENPTRVKPTCDIANFVTWDWEVKFKNDFVLVECLEMMVLSGNALVYVLEEENQKLYEWICSSFLLEQACGYAVTQGYKVKHPTLLELDTHNRLYQMMVKLMLSIKKLDIYFDEYFNGSRIPVEEWKEEYTWHDDYDDVMDLFNDTRSVAKNIMKELNRINP